MAEKYDPSEFGSQYYEKGFTVFYLRSGRSGAYQKIQ